MPLEFSLPVVFRPRCDRLCFLGKPYWKLYSTREFFAGIAGILLRQKSRRPTNSGGIATGLLKIGI